MDDFITEKWTLDDGRRAERRVTEQKNCDDGQIERVVELHVEDERPLKLQQRVVEKSKPFVYERKIDTIDPKTGVVIEQKVESIEPRIQMQLVEHISSVDNTVSAQSIASAPDCHITREEMIDTIVAAMKAMKNQDVEKVEDFKMQDSDLSIKLNSLGLADEIGKTVKDENISLTTIIYYVAILASLGVLGYILFFMQ